MNIVLQYDPTEMPVWHDDDVSIHVVFRINHRRSELIIEHINTHVEEPHIVQGRASLTEIQPPVTSHVVSVREEQPRLSEQVQANPLQEEVSRREREVLELVAKGLSNQQIAEVLVLSVDTVKRHMSNIFSKLCVRNRMQAVVQARMLGLLVRVPADVSTSAINRAER